MRPSSLIVLLCVGLLIAFWFPPFSFGNDKESAKGSVCLSTVKQQTTGLLQYASDHDDRYPFRDAWMDATRRYVVRSPGAPPDALERCSSLARSGGYGYAFNSRLSHAKEPARPETVPLIYDSLNPIRNASDRMTSLPPKGRHKGKNTVAYADGHARRVAPESAP